MAAGSKKSGRGMKDLPTGKTARKVKGGGSAKLPVTVSRELPKGVVSVPAHSYEAIRDLISKIEPSALKAEEGGLVWLAGITAGKD